MNLATARSVKKQKEISIKKILGANRKRLVLDSLTETVLFSLIAFQLAIVLVELIRPLFNRITGKELAINYLEPQLLLIAFLILVIISLVSAIYPYLFLKSNKPVNFLRSKIIVPAQRISSKKILVVFQFIVSTILIIFAGVVIKQISFIYAKDLGFNKENIIVVNSSALSGKERVFKAEILQHPDVICASIGKTPFGGGWPALWSWEGKSEETRLDVVSIYSDSDYLEVLGIKLLDGRFFKDGFVDTNKVVINQKFADLIGNDHILGKEIIYGEHKYEILGIIDNIYSHHFSNEVKPAAIFNEPTHKFLIQVKEDKMLAVLDHLKSSFEKLVDDRNFEYTTIQDQFNYMFEKEVRFGKLFGYFSFLAIFISCLGLFGVSVFASEQRTKEIGIRKVLGASSNRILSMLNAEFIKLVLIAYAISYPVAYYISEQWLQRFVYRTELSWWIFAVAGILVFLIANATISWYSIKVARRNPVDSLRYE
jgi:ABC-type antimicrobial peptide transport system permease subunit